MQKFQKIASLPFELIAYLLGAIQYGLVNAKRMAI
jgi:hypothetical protein